MLMTSFLSPLLLGDYSTCLISATNTVSSGTILLIQQSLPFWCLGRLNAELALFGWYQAVLLFCLHHLVEKSFVSRCSFLLVELSLPSISELLVLAPQPIWKGFLWMLLVSLLHSEFRLRTVQSPSLTDLSHCNVGSVGSPIPFIVCTVGDVALTRLNNFRSCLKCSFLNLDCFQFRSSRDSFGPLCALCVCPTSTTRSISLFVAGLSLMFVIIGLPVLVSVCVTYTAVWIDSPNFQRDIILFLGLIVSHYSVSLFGTLLTR